MADQSGLRQSYQNVLAENLKKGLGQTQNIYAGRGTTGSGSEATAFGELGRQFGLGTAQNELALQKFGEQQRQFDVGQGNVQQQFGLQQAGLYGQAAPTGGFAAGQQTLGGQQMAGNLAAQQAGLTGEYQGHETLQKRLAGQQFGLQQAQLFGQVSPSSGFQPGQQTLAGQQFGAGQQGAQRMDEIATQLGLPNSEALTLLAQTDPDKFARIFQQYQPTAGR